MRREHVCKIMTTLFLRVPSYGNEARRRPNLLSRQAREPPFSRHSANPSPGGAPQCPTSRKAGCRPSGARRRRRGRDGGSRPRLVMYRPPILRIGSGSTANDALRPMTGGPNGGLGPCSVAVSPGDRAAYDSHGREPGGISPPFTLLCVARAVSEQRARGRATALRRVPCRCAASRHTWRKPRGNSY